MNERRKKQHTSLHIKLRPELAKGLETLSKKRETSVDELVGQALVSCYQVEFLNLSVKQRLAVQAFQGGYISLGKLAEEMGTNVWKIRNWLEEHNIPQNNSFSEDDVENA